MTSTSSASVPCSSSSQKAYQNQKPTQLVHRAAAPCSPPKTSISSKALSDPEVKSAEKRINSKQAESDQASTSDASSTSPHKVQHRLCDPAEHFARQSANASRRAGRTNTRQRFRQQNVLFEDLLLSEAEREAVQTTLTIRGAEGKTKLETAQNKMTIMTIK